MPLSLLCRDALAGQAYAQTFQGGSILIHLPCCLFGKFADEPSLVGPLDDHTVAFEREQCFSYGRRAYLKLLRKRVGPKGQTRFDSAAHNPIKKRLVHARAELGRFGERFKPPRSRKPRTVTT